MKFKINHVASDHGFISGIGVEYDGIRNAWPCTDDLGSKAAALADAARWLEKLSTLSDGELSALREANKPKADA